MRKRILVIDPLRENIAAYIKMLKLGGVKVFDMISASSLDEARMFLTLQPISLIIVNAQFVGEVQMDIYKQALRYHPTVKIIFLHSKSERDHAALPQNSCYSNEQGLMMLLRNAAVCLS